MKNLFQLATKICSFVVFMICIGGCKAFIKTMDHPIDPIKSRQLLNAESPVVSINFWYVSIMALILTVLLFFVWIVGWKKPQKREADSV